MLRPDHPNSASPASKPDSQRGTGSWFGTVILLGAAWLILINQLRIEWEVNPQYSYGWLVPFLAAYLFWCRWPSRPEADRQMSLLSLGLVCVPVALAFFPTRIIREAAPDWSVVSWALALQTVLLTLGSVAWMGGWKSLRHFAWPICFFLVAVAWPARFEIALTQGLMQYLAALTAELVGWAGVSAVAEGNLIHLRTGLVGVDEACSGVRSLQSMLMASIFLGELNRLSTFGRIGLVVAGLGLAIIFNIVRALVLVTVAIRGGLGAIEKWHDPAGFSILAVSFVALCFLVKLFHHSSEPVDAEPVSRKPWRPLPPVIWASMLGWLVCTEIATEAWYRSHESHMEDRLGWSVKWPETQAEFQDQEISSKVRTILAFDEGRKAAWQASDGSAWLMFSFKWYAARTSTLWARQHRPEVCLPAGGSTLLSEYPPVVIQVGELQIPFRAYEFDSAGEPLHVFFCLWEVGNRDLDKRFRQDFTRESRLQRVFAGQRNLGQQSLEVIIGGKPSREEAEAAFRAQMEACLTVQRS